MARHTPGRHRFGTPGLRHCREFPAVRERLDELHPPRTTTSITPGMTVVLLAIGAAALVVTGWLAGGAPAIADIVGR